MGAEEPTSRRGGVDVTADDYRAAVQNASARCAVARAVKRAFPDASRVMVDIQTIRFTRGEERFSWLTPAKAQDMIVAFDGGEWSRLEPFRFDLRRDKAIRIARKVFASAEDRERSNAARRKGETRAGMANEKRTAGARPPRRSMGGGDRAYGARALSINKYRAEDGLLGEVEEVSVTR